MYVESHPVTESEGWFEYLLYGRLEAMTTCRSSYVLKQVGRYFEPPTHAFSYYNDCAKVNYSVCEHFR